MPLVEDLYFTDHTQTVRNMKVENGLISKDEVIQNEAMASGRERVNQFFNDFILQVENEVMESLGCDNFVQAGPNGETVEIQDDAMW